MANEQIAGNLTDWRMSFEIFRDKVTKLSNAEIIAIAPYLPASWFGWPEERESAKAEFIKQRLIHVLAHRGLTLEGFMETIRRNSRRIA